MAGYFRRLYNFGLDVIKYKDNIECIVIENTSNYTREFSNLRVRIIQKPMSMRIRMLRNVLCGDSLSEKERGLIKEERILQDNISIIFCRSEEPIKKYNSWTSMVESAYDIYDDIKDIFHSENILIPIKLDILGFKNQYDAIKRAREKDIEELLESKEVNLLKKEMEDYYYNVFHKFKVIEDTIKNQKRAYILSKLIENKATRKDYLEYPSLIEAFDTYIDIKKAISKKKYI